VERHWIVIGAVLAGLGVALGAFGSHALRAALTENGRLETYQTAVQYHLIHALALIAVGLLSAHISSPQIGWAGGLITLGVLIFSGSLYILSIFNIRIMGAVTPIGGVALLLGWASFAWAAYRG
jgi:uncharacterized membrane protein YgdD (TMEM256/DUF423 family)